MTLKELEQAGHLSQEIKNLQEYLNELNNKSQVGATKLTGMPSGAKACNKIEEYTVKKADLNAIITKLKADLEQQKARIADYISSLDDSVIRDIMMCKYVRLMSWRQTARKVYGTPNKESTCRDQIKNFFIKNKSSAFSAHYM